LAVTWDEHGERYKAWREVVAESSRCEFGDWSDRFDAAPPATLGLMKSFLRHGGDPVRWKDEWLRELGMGRHERTAIEVAMIVRTLQYLGTYDQLNLPCLAGAEVLCQRLAQLIEAYAGGDRSSPNYRAVKHFTMESSAAQMVPSALRNYAHRKSKEEHDMEALRSRAGGFAASGAQSGHGDDEGDDGAGPPLGRRAKAAKGRGKGGDKAAASAKLTAPAAK
jgi:hypothetical protein